MYEMGEPVYVWVGKYWAIGVIRSLKFVDHFGTSYFVETRDFGLYLALNRHLRQTGRAFGMPTKPPEE